MTFLIFRDRVSLCIFGVCPGTHSVDQPSLKLTEICLPLPPECLELKACVTIIINHYMINKGYASKILQLQFYQERRDSI